LALFTHHIQKRGRGGDKGRESQEAGRKRGWSGAGLAFDVVFAGLGGQRHLVQIVEVGVEQRPPGGDPLGGVVDQHLEYRVRTSWSQSFVSGSRSVSDPISLKTKRSNKSE